ncbi:MAG: (2Fe-2S)-binding protein, partial [Candidatus Glassbacteria bacterium]|nr:(2Fe-2S)-binding protein [Candidatus Glassbacteria bacterium]
MSQTQKKTVRTVIDGTGYEFPEGTSILEAARSVGVEIPHYCYHPGLSIAGACRMCLVEIEKIPKLQISCYMTVGDGMVVHTNNERVRQARRAMLEFHLVNHPLDCPVCDQAGECGLQEYYMMHGLYVSRLAENKVKKTKKAFQIGPHVMLDQERCIVCSRCVRFCAEISKSFELGVFERGDRSEVDIFQDRRLDNPYSVNVVDICPVGALTEKDFRFKTRVWYLERAESVCPGCATGCNVEIHYNLKRPYKNDGRRIARIKPRYNPEVNEWWICDEGRYCFRFVDAPDRLSVPSVRSGDSLAEAAWDEALTRAAEALQAVASGAKKGEVAFLVSPRAANEELHLLRRVIGEQLPGSLIAFSNFSTAEPTEDDFLRRADKNPNTAGARLIGLTPEQAEVIGLDELKAKALAGEIGALYICYHDPPGLPEVQGRSWEEALDRVGKVIFQGTNSSATSERAQVVLPAAAFAEREGSVVNAGLRLQLQRRAFDPLAGSLPGWEI